MLGKGSSWTMSVLISASEPNIARICSLQMWAKQGIDSGYGETEERQIQRRKFNQKVLIKAPHLCVHLSCFRSDV